MMKKIISGRRYDTATATLVHEASANCPRNDFAWWSEDLYRTPKGIWFVVGEGGPMSRYAHTVGNTTTGSSDELRPISAQQAREWLEHYGTAELVEEHFRAELVDA